MTQLSAPQEQAAILIAEDRLSDSDIASHLGVSRASIARWKRRSEFQERVTVLQTSINEKALTFAIANREERMEALDDRWGRLKTVIIERADDPSMADVPGGKTGLMLRTYRSIGVGETATIMPEYAVDVATLREMRETEKQAAQEMGQWSEKSETKAEQHVTFTIDFDRAGQDG